MAVTSSPDAPSPHCGAMMNKDNYRTRLLDEASNLINGDRQDEYGPPADNFQRVADLWNAFGDQDNAEIEAWQVCVFLALLKVARLSGPKPSWDTFVDASAYFALAGEIFMQRKRDHDVS